MRRAFVGLGLGGMALLIGSMSAAGPSVMTAKMDPGVRAELVLARRSTVAMFVKTTDVARTQQEIARLGGSVGTVSGDILTVRMPLASVAAMAQSPSVVRLEAAHRVTRRLDKLLPETKADQVHSGAAGMPYKGAGVVVGVIDYGLDLGHEAFKKAGGATRVIGLWDQGATGTPPTGYTYGAGCDAAALAGNTCGHSDTGTHGTHVTGIAAGGPIAGTPFLGMAPEADIAFVHLGSAPGAASENDALTTAICDGAAYIFKVAAAANKPAVINMSLGEHSGPHDGTSLADQCLDNLTGPGKIIVAAAGNEGQGSAGPGGGTVFVHASGTSTATPNTARFVVGAKGTGELYFWYDAPADLSIRIGAIDAGGTTAFTAPITRTQPLAATMLTVGALTVGPVAGAGGELPSGARGAQVVIGDGNSDMQELNGVQWILEVTGAGKFDAFVDTTSQSGFLQANLGAGLAVDHAMTIGFPAIASKVIAVGSYVTRNEWTPVGGGPAQTQTDNDGKQVVIGALSGFSSRGPARRATVVMQKPEIAAPGELIASALNSRGTVDANRVMKASPNGVFLSEGTSMASPTVAGAVALMLQRNPKLTVEEVKRILASTAVAPPGPPAPNTSWGAGKLNALAAVQAVGAAPPPPPADGGAPPADGGTPAPAPTGSTPDTTPPAAAAPAASSGGCSQTPMSPASPVTWLSVGGLALALAAGLRRARRK